MAEQNILDKPMRSVFDIFNEVGPVISFNAIQNLNGYEITGHTLRFDNACTEKSRLEMQSLMIGMSTSESYYGDAVNPEKAPEITNNNNPVEARNMLLQNTQLGYALLQALIRMKIVDPEIAIMLHPAHKVPPPLRISNATATSSRFQPIQKDWQHNNIYRGQSTSQGLRQPPPSQMLLLQPATPLLSNIEPPLSFM
ncbi:hypothetical protein QTP88_027267 [Uroleucon formosanum]